MTIHAEYFDGRSALSQNVTLEFDQEQLGQLIIKSTNGYPIDVWPLGDVVSGSKLKPTKSAYLYRRTTQKNGHTGQTGAYLFVRAETGAMAELLRKAPVLNISHRQTQGFMRKAIIITLALVFAVFTFLSLLPRLLVEFMPVSWEMGIGRAIHESLITYQTALDEGPAVTAINGLTQRLLGGHRLDPPLDITILCDDTVNAFALPGHRMIILQGLIDKADTPEEIAFVVSHELAHIRNRDPVRGLGRTMGLQMAFSLIAPGSRLAGVAETLAGQAYSRAVERDADRMGLDMLIDNGISTEGAADFFARIETHHGAGRFVPELLKSHPETSRRIDAARLRHSTGTAPALTPAEFQDLKLACKLRK